jgi:hypothetical protein
MISDEQTDRLDAEFYDLMYSDIDEHHQLIDEINFNRMISYYIYCMYEGEKIGVTESDYWHFDLELKLGKEKYLELLEKYENDIQVIKQNQLVNDEQLLEEFQKVILEDKNLD